MLEVVDLRTFAACEKFLTVDSALKNMAVFIYLFIFLQLLELEEIPNVDSFIMRTAFGY